MDLAEKRYPAAEWQSTPFCVSAKIKAVNATAAEVQAIYSVNCVWGDPRRYLCVDPKDNTLGNRYYAVTARASCKGSFDGDAACVDVAAVRPVGPTAPAKMQPGAWYPIADDRVPGAIQAAALKAGLAGAAVTRLAAPELNENNAYPGHSRIDIFNRMLVKLNASGASTLRVPVSVVTRSLAAGCKFPVIKEVAFVDVAGSGKAVGLTDAQFSRAERENWGDDAYDGDPRCVCV